MKYLTNVCIVATSGPLCMFPRVVHDASKASGRGFLTFLCHWPLWESGQTYGPVLRKKCI